MLRAGAHKELGTPDYISACSHSLACVLLPSLWAWADITKLRRDVLKQAIASLAAFIGSVNYSESFHMSAMNQQMGRQQVATGVAVDNSSAPVGDADAVAGFSDNPLYDPEKVSRLCGPDL